MTATDTAGDVSVSTAHGHRPVRRPVGADRWECRRTSTWPKGIAFSLAGVVDNPTPGDDLTESWTVTAGDGSEAPYTVSGPNVTYTPDDIGSYTVTLNLLNSSSQIVASASQQILSIGVAPTATISGGPSGGTTTEGTTLAFSGAASSPSTVTSAKGFFYTWGVTLGAFTYVAPTTPTTNPTSFSFTPGQAGTYVVSLSVTDDHGFTSVAATQTVAVAAVAPSVTITGLPAGSVTEGTTVALGSIVTNPSAVLESAGFSESWTVQFGGATYGPYLRSVAEPHAGLRRQLYRGPDGHGCRGHLVHNDSDGHRRRHCAGRHALGLAHGTAARAGDHHRVQPWQRRGPWPRRQSRVCHRELGRRHARDIVPDLVAGLARTPGPRLRTARQLTR